MSEKSGYTKKTTDWLGREKEEHFDTQGNKVGETKFTTDWLGRQVQEHFDSTGRKTGETKRGSDWLGRDRAEHFDERGIFVGYSRDDTDWLGRPVQRHYDTSGQEVGITHRVEDWLGRPLKEHEGEYFKARPQKPRTAGTYTDGSSDSSSGTRDYRGNCSFAKKCLYVLGAFVSWGILACLVYWGPPYLAAKYPDSKLLFGNLSEMSFAEGIGGSFLCLVLAIVGLALGIVIPLGLLIKASE